MKIIKTDGQSCLLKMTQTEWAEIGAKQNWTEPQQKKSKATEEIPAPQTPADDSKPDIGNEKFLLPTGDTMTTRVDKYGEKFWAVYIEGEFGEQLLGVMVYLKGAAYVKRVIDDLVTRLSKFKGETEVLGDEVLRLREQGQIESA